jgi:hypothetical protein
VHQRYPQQQLQQPWIQPVALGVADKLLHDCLQHSLSCWLLLLKGQLSSHSAQDGVAWNDSFLTAELQRQKLRKAQHAAVWHSFAVAGRSIAMQVCSVTMTLK